MEEGQRKREKARGRTPLKPAAVLRAPMMTSEGVWYLYKAKKESKR
jgi:hypothetical protein